MSLDIGTLVGFLDLDTAPFDKKVDEAPNKMSKVSAGALAFGTAAGGLLAKGFADSVNIDAANDKLAAQLGLTGEQSAMYGDIAGSLYADAYGGSIEEVNDALGAVSSSLGEFVGQSEEALQGATAKAMDLASAFGIDVNDAAAMVGQTLQHGLARDADHAFDLITVSMQKMPAAIRGELIPMIDEYGVHLKAMGFEGEDAFGLLVNASQDGTYAIDKTVDAIKELAIRATDGSETTVQAFEAIGLDADEMAGKVLEGGESARGALDDIIDGLLAMPDSAAQAQAAIDLFGAPLEDMSVTQIPDFLRGLRDSADVMGEVEGAADDVGAALADNLGSKLDGVKRKAQLFLVDFLESPFGPWIAGGVLAATGLVALVGPMQTLIGNARTVMTSVRSASGSIKSLGATGGAAAGVTAVAGALFQLAEAQERSDIDQLAEEFMATGDAATVLEAAMSSSRNGADKLVGTFSALLEANTESAERFLDQAEAAGASGRFIDEARAAVEEKKAADAQGAIDAESLATATDEQAAAMGGAAQSTEDAVAAMQEYSDAIAAQMDPIFGLIDAQNSSRDARNAVTEAEMALSEATRTHGANSLEAMVAQQALTDAQFGAVESAAGLEQAEIALAQAIAGGDVSVSELTDRLNQWVATGSITRAEADMLSQRYGVMAERVRGIPAARNTNLSQTGGDGVIRTAGDLARSIFDIPTSRTVTIRFNTAGELARSIFPALAGRAAGGPVRAGQAYIVGEQRPELFVPDEDGVIIPQVPTTVPSGAAMSLPSGGGGGAASRQPVVVRLVVDGSAGDKLADWMRDRVHVDGGGDVQLAFGR